MGKSVLYIRTRWIGKRGNRFRRKTDSQPESTSFPSPWDQRAVKRVRALTGLGVPKALAIRHSDEQATDAIQFIRSRKLHHWRRLLKCRTGTIVSNDVNRNRLVAGLAAKDYVSRYGRNPETSHSSRKPEALGATTKKKRKRQTQSALRQICSSNTLSKLSSDDPDVKLGAVAALGQPRWRRMSTVVVPKLTNLLQDADARVRKAAATVLGKFNTTVEPALPRPGKAREASDTVEYAKTDKSPRRTRILTNIAKVTGLTEKQVAAVFDALAVQIKKSLDSRGPGVFIIPGLVKIVKVRVPGRPAKKGVPNPFKPGKLMDVSARPAYNKVKVRLLKDLKDMV